MISHILHYIISNIIDKYYIYIYINNINHKYNFDVIDNNLFLFITNKNKNAHENFKLKIMYENKECYLKYKDIKDNIIKIGLLENLNFNDAIDFSNLLELGNNYFVYEINHNSKCEYIVMEYLNGEDMSRLRDFTRSAIGTIPAPVVVYLLLQMIDCTKEMHEKGFIHRYFLFLLYFFYVYIHVHLLVHIEYSNIYMTIL